MTRHDDGGRSWDARFPPPLTWRDLLDAAAATLVLLGLVAAFCAFVLLGEAVVQ